MELKDTIKMMQSADYKERFKAEYLQTKIRYDKLHKMLTKADAGTLEFTPTCPLDLLRDQKANMGKYLYCLEVRAEMEGIDLKCTKEKHIFGDCTTCIHAKKTGEHEWECDAEHYDIEHFTCYSPMLAKAN